MNLLTWFDSADAEAFGTALAKYFLERVPVQTPESKVKSTAKKQEALRKMFYKVDQFRAKGKLNFYKKAKFGNAFQWTLKDAGCPSDLVSELTKELLLRL
ncbi:MAG: hypothetical protein HXX19_02385 [Rhodoferax sp.]|nr:hypothetical protein [Rhodoferax sp.]